MLVSLSLYILVIGALIAYLAAEKLGAKTGYLVFAIIAAVQGITHYAYVYSRPYVERISWVDIPGFMETTLFFKVDGIGFLFVTIIMTVTALAAIYSVGYMEHAENIRVYYMAYLIYVAGMYGAIVSYNLIQFFFFWELMLIPSYYMIAEWGYGDRRRVAFKYFLYTQLGSILLIIAIAILGTLSVEKIGVLTFDLDALYGLIGSIDMATQRLLLFLMLIGFGVKMALVPLHGWLPEAHAEAPTPISVILSGVMIEIGLYGLIRYTIPFTLDVWGSEFFTNLLLGLALITLFYGGLNALVQRDVKRLLAYSSISQMGYMFLGVAALNFVSLEGGIYHVFSHGLLKALLFMVAGVMIHVVGVRSLDQLGGLAGKMPLTASLAIIGAMGIAGLPGIAAFISEFMIFGGVWEANTPYRLAFLFIAVLGSALSAAYMTVFIREIFFRELPEELEGVGEAPLTMLIPMAGLAILAIVFGVYPKPLLDILVAGLEEFFTAIGGVA